MSREILLLVDALAREKNVARETEFTALAMALASATRSWLARERRRTRRPKVTLGQTTNTNKPMTCTISMG